jgi:hypothetical protein
MTSSKDPLIEAFVQLLERFRIDYAQWASSNDIPFTRTDHQIIVIATSETDWQTTYQTAEVNTASYSIRNWGPLDTRLRDDCLDIAADIIAAHSSSLPYWVFGFGGLAEGLLSLPAEQIGFKEQPNIWVARYVVVPAAVRYIECLESANTGDSNLAQRIVGEAIELVSSKKLKMTSYLPVAGISLEEEKLACDGLVVRELTPRERGVLLERQGVMMNIQAEPEAFDYGSNHLSAVLPRYLIELTQEFGRAKQPLPGSYYKNVLCAFFLHGYQICGPGRMVSSMTPEWAGFGRLGSSVQLRPQLANSVSLTKDGLKEIKNTLNRLRNYNLDHPASSRDLALHRFLLGSTRENPIDSLLDYLIALECFFLPYDPATRHSDISYRFRLHGAHYLGDSVEERIAIWRQMRELYDIRSRLVHGSDYPSGEEVRSYNDIARELSVKSFLKAVNSHFPRVEDFNRWALE